MQVSSARALESLLSLSVQCSVFKSRSLSGMFLPRLSANGCPPHPLQGLDTAHKQRVAEVLNDPESTEKRRSRESLNADVVKYESGPDGGEEVSMSVEWNGVSTAWGRRAPVPVSPVSPLDSCFSQIKYE